MQQTCELSVSLSALKTEEYQTILVAKNETLIWRCLQEISKLNRDELSLLRIKDFLCQKLWPNCICPLIFFFGMQTQVLRVKCVTLLISVHPKCFTELLFELNQLLQICGVCYMIQFSTLQSSRLYCSNVAILLEVYVCQYALCEQLHSTGAPASWGTWHLLILQPVLHMCRQLRSGCSGFLHLGLLQHLMSTKYVSNR